MVMVKQTLIYLTYDYTIFKSLFTDLIILSIFLSELKEIKRRFLDFENAGVLKKEQGVN